MLGALNDHARGARRPVTVGEFRRILDVGDERVRRVQLSRIVPFIDDPEILMQVAAYAEPFSRLDVRILLRAQRLLRGNAQGWNDLTRRARKRSLVWLSARTRCFLQNA